MVMDERIESLIHAFVAILVLRRDSGLRPSENRY
jgi:hypothetical protein